MGGQRAGVDSQKFTLFLNDGELYEEDTLRMLQIQQRETLHVLPKVTEKYSFSTESSYSFTPSKLAYEEHPKPLPSTQLHVASKEIKITPVPTRVPSGYPPTTTTNKFSHFFYHYENQKTLRPLKSVDDLAPKKYELREQAKILLQRNENLKLVVALPVGHNENDWLALNTVSFFNNANIIYSKFGHSCTAEICPHTTAGQQNYLWMDAVKKMPVDIPAPEYFANLFEWILKDNFNDESKFPPLSSDDAAYSVNFNLIVADISRRIFRVYAHLYHQHYTEISENTVLSMEDFEKSFELFYHFVSEFKLVSENDLKPMEGLIKVINL